MLSTDQFWELIPMLSIDQPWGPGPHAQHADILTSLCSVRADCLALTLLCIMQLPPPVIHQERAIWGVTCREEIRAEKIRGPIRLEDSAPMGPEVYRVVLVPSTLWGPSS